MKESCTIPDKEIGEVLGVVYQPGLENLGLRKGHASSNLALSANSERDKANITLPLLSLSFYD